MVKNSEIMVNTSKGLKGLTGLGGLSALPESDRNAWLAMNKERLAAQGVNNPTAYARLADRYYRNDLFRERFADINQDDQLLKSLTPEQRDEIYKEQIVNDAFIEAYSPYTDEKDAYGNPRVNPNKGMGNEDEFQKYMAMDSDSKIKLLSSDWLTTPELNALEKEEHDKVDSELGSDAFISPVELGRYYGASIRQDIRDKRRDII